MIVPSEPPAGGAAANGGPQRRAVLLVNLGTPSRADARAIRAFLHRYLRDPHVLLAPPRWRWLHAPLARFAAIARSRRSLELYRAIWTERGSPLAVNLADQAAALQATLGAAWRVYPAMRHGAPEIPDVLSAIAAEGIDRLVVVPMFPHYCPATTGSILDAVYGWLRRNGRHMDVQVRASWHDDEGFIHAQAHRLGTFAQSLELHPENASLVFAAQSVPAHHPQSAMPYRRHLEESARLVAAGLGWPADRAMVAYIGGVGPLRGLEPRLGDLLESLARRGGRGDRRVLVCPIGYTADCRQTLGEIGLRLARAFRALGGELHLCPALNDGEPFIKALAQLTRRGARPVRAPARQTVPARPSIERLVMVGVSLDNPLGPGRGPKIGHVRPEQLRAIKRPQAETVELLRILQQRGEFQECWLWNTCNRFELYALLRPEAAAGNPGAAIDAAGRIVLGASRHAANVLTGAAALHHLARTAAGLNSRLPGDAEVLRQLESALRMAEQAGAAAHGAGALVARAAEMVDAVRRRTAWGDFSHEYSRIALEHALGAPGGRPFAGRALVIGGSATSHSVLLALRELGWPQERLTLVYRGHRRGRLMRMLRLAVGPGRMIRVDDYADGALDREAAAADAILLATDQRQPILTAGRLRAIRDGSRPLLVVDFNTFGSTRGLESLPGVRLVAADRIEAHIAGFAEGLIRRADFWAALQEAESLIEEMVAQAERGGAPATPVALGGAA